MSRQRFSSETLYELRNNIPIDALIENSLMIPSRTIEGYFRFLCPLCSEYNTAINPDTNLARCFSCEKNFNTIDLVMLIRQSDFIQSIYYLKNISESLSTKQTHGRSNPKCYKTESETKKINSAPMQLGKILGGIVQSKSGLNNNRNQTTIIDHKSVNDRILKLEESITNLIRRIDQIEASINPKISSN